MKREKVGGRINWMRKVEIIKRGGRKKGRKGGSKKGWQRRKDSRNEGGEEEMKGKKE